MYKSNFIYLFLNLLNYLSNADKIIGAVTNNKQKSTAMFQTPIDYAVYTWYDKQRRR